MKITAVMSLRNEDWVLEYCLRSLSFVDEIIAINDRSTDNTRSILEKYKCVVVDMDTSTKIGWKEYDIRTRLLLEARNRGATHVIAIDGDEACSEEFQKNARSIFESLKPGQALQMEWLTLCSKDSYLSPRIYKNFAFCDDGKSQYNNTFLHVSRVPETGAEPLILSYENCIFHYQALNRLRMSYKQSWYMMSEFLKKTRSARRINVTYSYVNQCVCLPLKENMARPEELPDPSLDFSIWQKDSILKLFEEYGVEYFEPLDIWHIEELRDVFFEKMNRKPIPNKFPKFLIKLNEIKNKIKANI